jgi:ferric-dicitrate binding protein FerR (iron transport regulator)
MTTPGGKGPDPAGEGDPELEELLRRAPSPSCGRAARERARERFLAEEEGERSRAAPPGRTGPSMDRSIDSGDDAAEAEFERWLAVQPVAGLPARPEFRTRLRGRFLGQEERAPRPGRLRRFGIPLLAAAAIVAVTLFFPEPVRWKARLTSPVRLAGADYGVDAAGRMAVDLEGSGTLESLEGTVRVALGDVLELELRPGSELTFPMLPELDGVSPVSFQLSGGEMYVAARPGWPGNPIEVRTKSANVMLSGTTVGVLVDEHGTCVCVAEGKARVSGGAMDMPVLAGNSCYLFADPTTTPEWSEFPPDEELGGNPHVASLVAFAREE